MVTFASRWFLTVAAVLLLCDMYGVQARSHWAKFSEWEPSCDSSQCDTWGRMQTRSRECISDSGEPNPRCRTRAQTAPGTPFDTCSNRNEATREMEEIPCSACKKRLAVESEEVSFHNKTAWRISIETESTRFGCSQCDVKMSLKFDNGYFKTIALNRPYLNGYGQPFLVGGEKIDKYDILIPLSLGRLDNILIQRNPEYNEFGSNWVIASLTVEDLMSHVVFSERQIVEKFKWTQRTELCKPGTEPGQKGCASKIFYLRGSERSLDVYCRTDYFRAIYRDLRDTCYLAETQWWTSGEMKGGICPAKNDDLPLRPLPEIRKP